jgi:hypothetical protein
MIYTPKMKADIHALKVPHDFQVDLIEYDMYPPFIGLRFYESHWRHLNDLERLHCIEYMQKIKDILLAYGVNSTLDPVYDVPNGQQVK